MPNDVTTAQMIASGQPTTPDAVSTGTEGTQAPAGTTEAKPAPQDEVSKRLEALTRREIALSKKDRELKALETRSQAEVKAAKDEVAAFKTMKEKARTKQGAEALAKEVWGDEWYNHLTTMRLEGVTPQEWATATVEEKLKEFETKQETAARQAQEAHAAAEVQRATAAVTNYKNQITEHIKTKAAEGAELSALLGAEENPLLNPTDLAYQVVDFNYQQTGKVMSTEEAVNLTEKFLMDEFVKVMKLPKVRARFQEMLAADGVKQESKGDSQWREFIPEKKPAGGTVSTAPASYKNGVPDIVDRGVAILDRIMASRK